MGQELVRKLKSSNYSLLNLDDREKSVVLNHAQDEFVTRRTIADANTKQKGVGIDTKRDLDLSSIISSTYLFEKANGDFIEGNENNGAFRTPDLDYQELEEGYTVELGETYEYDASISRYGVMCNYPNEALYILSEHATISRGMEIRTNVPVKRIPLEKYMSDINNIYENPGKHTVWRIETGNFTPASAINGFTSLAPKGGVIAGDTATTSLSTSRINHLIPGKDFIVESYRMSYVKRPRRIVVDTIYPAGKVDCELHPAVHDEIVDIAVSLVIQASIPELQKYQIADKEKREDE